MHKLYKMAFTLQSYTALHGVFKLPCFQHFLVTTLDMPEDSLVDLPRTPRKPSDRGSITEDITDESDLSTFDFAELKSVGTACILYDFRPETLNELEVAKGEIVDIIQRPNEDWLHVRTQSGKMGYVPANHVCLLI